MTKKEFISQAKLLAKTDVFANLTEKDLINEFNKHKSLSNLIINSYYTDVTDILKNIVGLKFQAGQFSLNPNKTILIKIE